jgi:tetratricopeptide (TPR) repeat protein
MSKKEKLIKKAESCVFENRIKKAIELYLEAFDSDPEDFHLLSLAGDLYIKLGKSTEACSLFLQAGLGYTQQNRLTEAISTYRRLHRADPSDSDVLMTLVDLCFKANLKNDAARFLHVAAKYYIDRADLTTEDEQQIFKLIKLNQNALKLNPNETDVIVDQGYLYQKVGKVDQAMALFMQSGSMLAREGKLEKGLEILNIVLKKKPHDGALIETISDILARLGRAEEALAIQERTLEQEPENLRLLKIMANTLIALMHYDRAYEIFKKLLALDKTFYPEFLKFGYLLVAQNELDRAVLCAKELVPNSTYLQKTELTYMLKKVIEKEPQHIEALTALASIYEQYNEVSQMLRVYPTLFDLHLKSGNQKKAFEVAQRLLDLNYREENFRRNYESLFAELAGGIPPIDAPGQEAASQVHNSAETGLSDAKASLDFGVKVNWDKQPPRAEGEESLLSNVEILCRYGHFETAIDALKSRLASEPKNETLHERLKSVYVNAKLLSHAARECIELFKIYRENGQEIKSQEVMKEALKLEPTLSLKMLELSSGKSEGAAGFAGDFTVFTICDVIQFLENSQKSGILTVIAPNEEGKLYFNDGQIADAQVGDKTGIAAVYHLIRVTMGSYEFEAREGNFPQKIRVSTTNLLLEGLRIYDEERAKKTKQF